jgi:hypothetical protein
MPTAALPAAAAAAALAAAWQQLLVRMLKHTLKLM